MFLCCSAFADIHRVVSFCPMYDEAIMLEHEYIRFIYSAEEQELVEMEGYLKELDAKDTKAILKIMNGMAKELPITKEYKIYNGKCYVIFSLSEYYETDVK